MSLPILNTAQVRHLILLNRERKRESNDIFELPESKKPKLSEGVTVGQEEFVPVAADMDLEAKSGSASKRQGKAQKTADGGGSFKENPYTFLAPNDPILLTCM